MFGVNGLEMPVDNAQLKLTSLCGGWSGAVAGAAAKQPLRGAVCAVCGGDYCRGCYFQHCVPRAYR